MKSTTLLLLLIVIHMTCCTISLSQEKMSTRTPIFGRYDAMADPAVQLKTAITEATKSGKKILLEVGGEWCIWCHYLDDFFEKNRDVTKYIQDHFILIKIHFGPENKNEKFLSGYPKVAGYPHLFVLDSDGSFLHSQETAALESGRGYDRDIIMKFLADWGPEKQ